MRLSRHILLCRLLALLFLFILLYAQGVKALHRHPGATRPGNSLHGKFITAAHTCDICNYQLAKEMLLPANVLYVAVLPGACLLYTPPEHRPGAIARWLQGNKGPPPSALFVVPSTS